MSPLTLFFRTLLAGILAVWVIYFFSTFPQDVKIFFGKIQCYEVEEKNYVQDTDTRGTNRSR